MALRVLIVDDSRMARSLVSRTFQRLGCEVVGLAGDGYEAIDMYKRLNPDFVTLDLVMPKLSGQETLKALKEYDPAAVVVVVSSLSRKEAVLECVRAGASHYLIKPFREDNVRDVLTKIFPDVFAPDGDGRPVFDG